MPNPAEHGHQLIEESQFAAADGSEVPRVEHQDSRGAPGFRKLHLQIPLLSDFHPKGEISRCYNVYREDIGTCERALYVMDGKGVIYWSHVSPVELIPGADGVLDRAGRPGDPRALSPMGADALAEGAERVVVAIWLARPPGSSHQPENRSYDLPGARTNLKIDRTTSGELAPT